MTTIRILQGDVLKGLAQIPDESVQCVVTSPPYWGLRDYGVEGQIGLEPTPEEYVEKMVGVFQEVRRVLRKDGTVWLNMGDCYAGSGCGSNDYREDGASISANHQKYQGQKPGIVTGLKPKDLVGMPWRLAFALQADGWWLRSDIIWSKPNPMPESVADRPTKAHEYLFLLAKDSRYFYDADAIRESHKEPERGNGHLETIGTSKGGTSLTSGFSQKTGGWADSWSGIRSYNPAGRNRRTVWEIPTQPFPEAHFATFPEKLVEPCIKAGTSERGCCPKCGAPWERVVEPDPEYKKLLGKSWHGHDNDLTQGARQESGGPKQTTGNGYRTIGWSPGCSCGTEPVPCVVLDPFAGSGTVAKVARYLGRSSIMIELSPAYVEIMKRRLRLHEQLIQAATIEQVRSE
jgi:DNA modification methylase